MSCLCVPPPNTLYIVCYSVFLVADEWRAAKRPKLTTKQTVLLDSFRFDDA